MWLIILQECYAYIIYILFTQAEFVGATLL